MKGIIIELKRNTAIVLQNDGRFVESIKPDKAKLGDEIVVNQKSTIRNNVWIPLVAAAAFMLAFIGLWNNSIINKPLIIDDDPTPLGVPHFSTSPVQPALIQLPGDHLLTIWLSEDAAEVSWRGEIPITSIVLKCEDSEYLYYVGDYLGINGLSAPTNEIIYGIGVFSDPDQKPANDQNAYLVLSGDNQLTHDIPDPNADYYAQMIWLFDE